MGTQGTGGAVAGIFGNAFTKVTRFGVSKAAAFGYAVAVGVAGNLVFEYVNHHEIASIVQPQPAPSISQRPVEAASPKAIADPRPVAEAKSPVEQRQAADPKGPVKPLATATIEPKRSDGGIDGRSLPVSLPATLPTPPLVPLAVVESARPAATATAGPSAAASPGPPLPSSTAPLAVASPAPDAATPASDARARHPELAALPPSPLKPIDDNGSATPQTPSASAAPSPAVAGGSSSDAPGPGSGGLY